MQAELFFQNSKKAKNILSLVLQSILNRDWLRENRKQKLELFDSFLSVFLEKVGPVYPQDFIEFFIDGLNDVLKSASPSQSFIYDRLLETSLFSLSFPVPSGFLMPLLCHFHQAIIKSHFSKHYLPLVQKIGIEQLFSRLRDNQLNAAFIDIALFLDFHSIGLSEKLFPYLAWGLENALKEYKQFNKQKRKEIEALVLKYQSPLENVESEKMLYIYYSLALIMNETLDLESAVKWIEQLEVLKKKIGLSFSTSSLILQIAHQSLMFEEGKHLYRLVQFLKNQKELEQENLASSWKLFFSTLLQKSPPLVCARILLENQSRFLLENSKDTQQLLNLIKSLMQMSENSSQDIEALSFAFQLWEAFPHVINEEEGEKIMTAISKSTDEQLKCRTLERLYSQFFHASKPVALSYWIKSIKGLENQGHPHFFDILKKFDQFAAAFRPTMTKEQQFHMQESLLKGCFYLIERETNEKNKVDRLLDILQFVPTIKLLMAKMQSNAIEVAFLLLKVQLQYSRSHPGHFLILAEKEQKETSLLKRSIERICDSLLVNPKTLAFQKTLEWYCSEFYELFSNRKCKIWTQLPSLLDLLLESLSQMPELNHKALLIQLILISQKMREEILPNYPYDKMLFHLSRIPEGILEAGKLFARILDQPIPLKFLSNPSSHKKMIYTIIWHLIQQRTRRSCQLSTISLKHKNIKLWLTKEEITHLQQLMTPSRAELLKQKKQFFMICLYLFILLMLFLILSQGVSESENEQIDMQDDQVERTAQDSIDFIAKNRFCLEEVKELIFKSILQNQKNRVAPYKIRNYVKRLLGGLSQHGYMLSDRGFLTEIAEVLTQSIPTHPSTD
jgi:glycosyltransferase involved in cell wall biosynthesis